MELIQYALDNLDLLVMRTVEHIALVGVAVGIATLTGVPIGIAITRNERLARAVLYLASIIVTIPSIALFGIMIPVLSLIGHGIGYVPAVIAVLLISICVDFFRVRALNRVAKATDSAALEADALHFFSDMLSSGVVLLGMVFVLLGFGRADAIAALIVAGFIFVAAIKLGKRSFDSLMDAAPAGATEAIRATLDSFPAVLACDSVRIRNAGAVLFVEITVAVCRTLPLERIDALKREIVERLRQQYAKAEFTVIAVPQTRSDEDMATRIRAIAANHGAQVQNVTLQQLPTHMAIGMDLAVPANASVAQAHDIATEIEGILRQAIGRIREAHAAGQELDLAVSGKRGQAVMKFEKIPVDRTYNQFEDRPGFDEVNVIAERYVAAVRGVTAADIQRVARAYLGTMRTIIVHPPR